MTFRGFEGPAGSGKTHRLMEAVTLHLQENPLLSHQKVLSLTFMHGSRRRLDAEFRGNPVLRGRAVAMTIDSFAHYVWHRWRSLAGMINAAIGNFNETCNACGHLLEQEAVARWVARSYPVIVVDEAQELAAPRLRMITALTGHCTVFVAADEFQSLDEGLDTTPFMEWFATGNITTLDHIHRTNKAGLLAAGANLRQLLTPGGGAGLNITYEWPNMAPFKIAAAIRNAQDKSAVLFPPGGAQWAQSLAQRLSQGLHSKRYNIPPIHLAHEARAVDEVDTMLAAMGDVEGIGYQAIVDRIAQAENQPLWTPRVQASLMAAASRMGKTQWTAVEVRTMIERTAANHRAYSNDRQRGIPLLSIHQAKNRQFENVIILWPPGVPGSDEFKARLLYNGITRARHNCKIFVRTQNLLNTAPFLFGA